MSTTTRSVTYATPGPHPAAARLDHVVRTTVQTMHAATATLDALDDVGAGSALARYRLSQLGVQAWIAGQRGQQLLAALGVEDRFDPPPPPTGRTVAPVTGDWACASAGVAGVLGDLLGPMTDAHRDLLALIGADDPHPALLFVHDVGAVCQEFATHVH